MQRRQYNPIILAVTAIMAAVVFALTLVKLLPTPDQGYIHPADGAIYFASFAFGPWVGAIVGGLGTCLGDIYGGAGQWAPFSLIIHGAQGWVAGWLSRRWPGIWGLILATVIGGLIVVIGYLPVGMFLASPTQALAAIPWNILQVTIGGVIGISLFVLVREAYPPIARLGR
jgi:uncharacterized membrane protein